MSIRRHPLTWFFALSLLLSWAAWTPYVLSGNGLGIWHFSFPETGGSSQLLGVLPGAYLGPIGSALLVTSLTEGRAGLRAWAGRMAKWRVSWRWYAGVILSVPAVLVVTSVLLGARGPVAPSVMVLTAYLPALVLQMVTTGLAEEPGWRDFAMPRLQRRYGPVGGTMVIGPLWGVWHLPLFLTEWGGWPDASWNMPVEFLLTTVAFSFVMTWVFNRTGESLPLAMLLHTSVNNFYSVAWSDMFPWLPESYTTHVFLLSSTVAAVILLIATRGRLGAPPVSGSAPRTRPGLTPRTAPGSEAGQRASGSTGQQVSRSAGQRVSERKAMNQLQQ
ncbi:CPBP family intramembrane glutamic endopeptidase [Streptomyces iconiensis]|uniref:Type II CAAX endopeptidase family protein n=1 Tax=Streptomyces iconiensis TaxID=1384038 RepID=A0ABT7A0E4_9ACTN|nr:type II CAAX endopeptidase family protein [Streptomyces iconiensis]MDJ1134795.1 type II CAAX endopeptidase family protein [Streptomyces iconiensis]